MKPRAAWEESPACACCGEPAVVYQPVTRRHLCGTHLVRDVEERVLATIQEFGQIHTGDRIAVALSGGKDSTALLVILSRLLSVWPGASLVAITVDEGIAGYRADTMRAAESLTGRLGVEHRMSRFVNLSAKTLIPCFSGARRRPAQSAASCVKKPSRMQRGPPVQPRLPPATTSMMRHSRC